MSATRFGFSPSPSEIASKIKQSPSRPQRPLVVAIDGGSGAGKSTLALLLAKELGAALITMDDFYAADIPDHHWDTFTVEERFQRCFDWERLRKDVLEPLLAGQPAQWYAFDFVSGLRADGTYGMEPNPKTIKPKDVILIDGNFSAAPILSDLVDFTILLDVPVGERHTRTANREEPDFLERWHRLWDPVEDYYHNKLRPPETYDLIVSG